MPTVKLHKATEGRSISECNAGSYAVVTAADDPSKIGAIVRLPYSTDETVIFFDRYIASTDRYRGVTRVIPLTKGDCFSVLID